MAKTKVGIILLVLILSCAQTVLAHHLWVSKKDDLYAVRRGIVPHRTDVYDPSKVVEMKAFGKDGSILSIQRQDENHGAFFKAEQDVSMALVRCDWGHRVNTTRGKKLMTVQEAEKSGFRVISSFFSTQFCKSLFAESDDITKPVNILFEIVPTKNPFEKNVGNTLPVMLIFEGKPLADTPVYSAKGQEFKTGRNGIALVNIEKKGTQLISATHKIPAVENSGLDYHKFTTFFHFEIK